jgi:hypothetical protein
MDVNSVFGEDPQFFDVNGFNFTVKPTSPAFKIGFHNFPYGNQGPVGRFGSPYVAKALLTSPTHFPLISRMKEKKNNISSKSIQQRWPRMSRRVF